MANLGCIELHPHPVRAEDLDHPDELRVDLDPVPGASFDDVREAALLVREALETLGMDTLVKTTGSSGIHVYVPIVRGPTQKQVWAFMKEFALALSAHKFADGLTTVSLVLSHHHLDHNVNVALFPVVPVHDFQSVIEGDVFTRADGALHLLQLQLLGVQVAQLGRQPGKCHFPQTALVIIRGKRD